MVSCLLCSRVRCIVFWLVVVFLFRFCSVADVLADWFRLAGFWFGGYSYLVIFGVCCFVYCVCSLVV